MNKRKNKSVEKLIKNKYQNTYKTLMISIYFLGILIFIILVMSNTNTKKSGQGFSGTLNNQKILDKETINTYINDYEPEQQTIDIYKGEEVRFYINPKQFQTITWFYDEELVKSKDKYYILKDTKTGIHEVKVQIINNELELTKKWEVEIKSLEQPKKPKIDLKIIFLYTTLIITIIIIILVTMLYYIEKKNPKTNFKQIKIQTEKTDSENANDFFNIPK